MKELTEIQTTLHAPKSQYNKFGGYGYRSCEDILTALKPLLRIHHCHVTLTDMPIRIGERIYIEATAKITNKDGEFEVVQGYAREADDRKGMDVSQITGAASSYARKYALNGLFAIDDSRDADSTNNHKEEQKLLTTKQLERVIELLETMNDMEVVEYMEAKGVPITDGMRNQICQIYQEIHR